jgi:WD40 repeat protein
MERSRRARYISLSPLWFIAMPLLSPNLPAACRHSAPRGLAAIALMTAAAVLVASPVRAQSYLQSGDAASSEYFGTDSAGARVLKRSDTKAYDVEVWDLSTNKRLSSITGLSGVVNVANISPDGRKVVTAERRGVVGLWDADTGKQIRLLRGHDDQIHDARFSPDGTMIASAARDGTARTWDTETGAQIATHQQKGGLYVDAVSFSPDGRWVLSAGNGWAEVWNARSGKIQTSVSVGPEDEGAFSTFARFSRDGKSIIVSDADGAPAKLLPIELPAE